MKFYKDRLLKYQQNNSYTITDVLLSYTETLRILGNRNHVNENT